MNFFKAIILPLTLILVACGTIPAQVPTENLASFASPHPSLTFTPKPSLTKTPTLTTTPTSTLAPIAPIPTLPALLTPEPALIQDFTGIYFLNDQSGAVCKFEIKRDATFTIDFVFVPTGMGETVDGTIFFADGQFFLISPKENQIPLFCFPRALVPVYWGERRYLFINVYIDDDEILAFEISYFCENVKNGKEPNADIEQYYFWRKTDIPVKATGSPMYQDNQLLCP